MQVMMNGDGHLLIQNSKGQRLGFDGKKIVNEIPGARFTVPRGGAGVKVEPVYYLPKGEAYNITIDGETVKAGTAGSSTVSIFGHDMSEEGGMEECARWLKTFITEVPIEYMPSGEAFWTPK